MISLAGHRNVAPASVVMLHLLLLTKQREGGGEGADDAEHSYDGRGSRSVRQAILKKLIVIDNVSYF